MMSHVTFSSLTSLMGWWSELLTTSHKVPGSIPGSAVGIFPTGEDPYSDHGLGSL
jgi:hypothetical protein